MKKREPKKISLENLNGYAHFSSNGTSSKSSVNIDRDLISRMPEEWKDAILEKMYESGSFAEAEEEKQAAISEETHTKVRLLSEIATRLLNDDELQLLINNLKYIQELKLTSREMNEINSL